MAKYETKIEVQDGDDDDDDFSFSMKFNTFIIIPF